MSLCPKILSIYNVHCTCYSLMLSSQFRFGIQTHTHTPHTAWQRKSHFNCSSTLLAFSYSKGVLCKFNKSEALNRIMHAFYYVTYKFLENTFNICTHISLIPHTLHLVIPSLLLFVMLFYMHKQLYENRKYLQQDILESSAIYHFECFTYTSFLFFCCCC